MSSFRIRILQLMGNDSQETREFSVQDPDYDGVRYQLKLRRGVNMTYGPDPEYMWHVDMNVVSDGADIDIDIMTLMLTESCDQGNRGSVAYQANGQLPRLLMDVSGIERTYFSFVARPKSYVILEVKRIRVVRVSPK